MERQEKYIDTLAGQRHPFKVPDGYFDDFADRLMSRLPEMPEASVTTDAQQPTLRVTPASRPLRWRKYVATAAACACIAMLSAAAYWHTSHADNDRQDRATATAASATTSTYSTMDALTDYTMLDSDDMYAYMADIK